MFSIPFPTGVHALDKTLAKWHSIFSVRHIMGIAKTRAGRNTRKLSSSVKTM